MSDDTDMLMAGYAQSNLLPQPLKFERTEGGRHSVHSVIDGKFKAQCISHLWGNVNDILRAIIFTIFPDPFRCPDGGR